VKTLPSYLFAALGAALVALGTIGLVWGEGAPTKTVFAIVGIVGVVLIIAGGIRRKVEAGEPHVLRGPGV
jgi:hypothetical protein